VTTRLRSGIFHGSLSHHRGGSVKNNFAYPVYTMLLDLDEVDVLDRESRLFSHGRRNVFSLHGRDYGLSPKKSKPSERAADSRSLKERALALLATASLSAEPTRIDLVTQLRVAGYVFNPVSFFVAYDDADRLVAVIAEINNTYDETFSYILDDGCRKDDAADAAFTTPKRFFVSPFIGDDCSYEWLFPLRRRHGELDIRMRLSRPPEAGGTGRFFAARLRGEHREFNDASLLRALVRFPVMPAQIWLRIHLQALRLRLLGLQYRRPSGHGARDVASVRQRQQQVTP